MRPSIVRNAIAPGSSATPAVAVDKALVDERRHREPHLANEAQQRSQISGGHRLLRLARERRLQLYTEAEFLSRIIYSDASYWMDSFVPALLMSVSENITCRVNAAIARARRNAAAYDVKRVGVAEHIAEAFYDNHLYKIREANVPRRLLRDRIGRTIARGEPIELIFPVFSRKPFSPLKNRGPHADLGELYSLARCVEATQTVNALSPTGCRMTLLADGLKYGRACNTPATVIETYQSSLHAWKNLLADNSVLRLVDYERWVTSNLRPGLAAARLPLYAQHLDEITETYRCLFDPMAPAESLQTIGEASDIGSQLAFTFWSIASSVNYQQLFSLNIGHGATPHYCSDEIQRLYTYFISSLHKPLQALALPNEFFPSIGLFGPADFRNLFFALRAEAFEAAIRYVSISLADRNLNIWREICPDAIKFTIHGKPGELHFLSASHRDFNITAQHSTGGISTRSDQINFDLKYRLEREANEETPVLVAALPAALRHRPEYEPLRLLHHTKQPIVYVDNPSAIMERDLHRRLRRGAK